MGGTFLGQIAEKKALKMDIFGLLLFCFTFATFLFQNRQK